MSRLVFQTLTCFYPLLFFLSVIFPCEEWLSVESNVMASLVSTVPEGEPLQFESRFFHQTRNQLSESNIWISILYRPRPSNFTRVERASCALLYIYLNMLASAMYYRPDQEYVTPFVIEFGPFKYSLRQVSLHQKQLKVVEQTTVLFKNL